MRHPPFLAKLLLALLGADLLTILAVPLLLKPRPSDLAVVFGNSILPGGAPSPRLKARLDEALALYKSGLVQQILVSGGIEPGSHAYSEPAVMAAYLHAHGIPASALLQDDAGRNTAATAANTAHLQPKPRRVLVVTQWFHVTRAVLAMRRQGFTNVSAAWPLFFEPRDVYSFLREAIAVPVYLLRPSAASEAVAASSSRQ